MKDKILFLDIDGVLNSDRFSRTVLVDNSPYGLELDPKAISLLKIFLETHDQLKIVISSSWRDTLSLTQFQELFATHGIIDRIIDLTSSEVGKAASIELWIQTHRPRKFAILDDDQLFDLPHRLHRYQVKTSMGLGLQPDHLASLDLLF